MTKLRVFKGFWTVEDVQKRPHCLFVFGDNDIGQGKGGQAIIRDLTNTIGIPTKKFPSNQLSSFYTDDELDLNKQKIDFAINELIQMSADYKYVIFPENGLGTGLANLPTKAPETFRYLNQRINDLMTVI